MSRSRGLVRWLRTSAKPSRAGTPLARAAAANKPTAGLETIEDQMKAMDSVPYAEQADGLDEFLGDPKQAMVRAGLVASQLLGMALCRYVLRLPPLMELSRAEVVGWLGPTVQRYVTGPMAAGTA